MKRISAFLVSVLVAAALLASRTDAIRLHGSVKPSTRGHKKADAQRFRHFDGFRPDDERLPQAQVQQVLPAPGPGVRLWKHLGHPTRLWTLVRRHLETAYVGAMRALVDFGKRVKGGLLARVRWGRLLEKSGRELLVRSDPPPLTSSTVRRSLFEDDYHRSVKLSAWSGLEPPNRWPNAMLLASEWEPGGKRSGTTSDGKGSEDATPAPDVVTVTAPTENSSTTGVGGGKRPATISSEDKDEGTEEGEGQATPGGTAPTSAAVEEDSVASASGEATATAAAAATPSEAHDDGRDGGKLRPDFSATTCVVNPVQAQDGPAAVASAAGDDTAAAAAAAVDVDDLSPGKADVLGGTDAGGGTYSEGSAKPDTTDNVATADSSPPELDTVAAEADKDEEEDEGDGGRAVDTVAEGGDVAGGEAKAVAEVGAGEATAEAAAEDQTAAQDETETLELLTPTREELEAAFPNPPRAPTPILPGLMKMSPEQLEAAASQDVPYEGQPRLRLRLAAGVEKLSTVVRSAVTTLDDTLLCGGVVLMLFALALSGALWARLKRIQRLHAEQVEANKALQDKAKVVETRLVKRDRAFGHVLTNAKSLKGKLGDAEKEQFYLKSSLVAIKDDLEWQLRCAHMQANEAEVNAAMVTKELTKLESDLVEANRLSMRQLDEAERRIAAKEEKLLVLAQEARETKQKAKEEEARLGDAKADLERETATLREELGAAKEATRQLERDAKARVDEVTLEREEAVEAVTRAEDLLREKEAALEATVAELNATSSQHPNLVPDAVSTGASTPVTTGRRMSRSERRRSKSGAVETSGVYGRADGEGAGGSRLTDIYHGGRRNQQRGGAAREPRYGQQQQRQPQRQPQQAGGAIFSAAMLGVQHQSLSDSLKNGASSS
eukprot:g8017.t1